MDSSFFFVFGGALVAMVLIISAIGIRGDGSFPGDSRTMVGLTALTAFVVVLTAGFAISNAAEEKKTRNKELAEAAATETEATGATGSTTTPAPAAPDGAEQPAAPSGEPTELALSSPEDGSLMFEPTTLQAAPGEITINYSNPSPVPHSIAIEADGETVAESETFSAGDGSATAELEAGDYTYFCSVPGHRESGMEGTLTVQ